MASVASDLAYVVRFTLGVALTIVVVAGMASVFIVPIIMLGLLLS